MNRPKPYVVVFAGVPGSSKSIIAYHLSLIFGLPIISTDNIRFEVKEDLRARSINLPGVKQEYERRLQERWQYMLRKGQPFIRDASVDRSWHKVRNDLQAASFAWFLIDMELSEKFIRELYLSTGRSEAVNELPAYLSQHQKFIKEYSEDVGVHITDKTFLRRREVSEDALRNFLSRGL